MLKGFKDFILRGNVVELAVAVVIGSAFQKVVDTFVTAIVTPVINAAGSPQSQGLGFSLRPDMAKETFVNLSTIINSLIVFLLTAAVVYFMFVAPMNRLSERARRGKSPEADAKSNEEILLEEIRDELRARRA